MSRLAAMPVDPSQLHILHYPAPVLRQRAQPIKDINDEVRAVAARMIALMDEAEGIGLAAPQVGLPWRLFVANARRDNETARVYINPKLVSLTGELEFYEEGCLSIPNIRAEIRRPTTVTIAATDLEGRPFTLTDDDLLARVWQHEYDHLDGVLIIDKMTPIDRLAKRRAIKDLEEAAED